MSLFYFDSGTSNTRGYLIRNGTVIHSGKAAVGSKDVSISGDRGVLVQGLKTLYDQVLWEGGASDEEVDGIYASGMITSPYGLQEVPHLLLPLHAEKLREGMVPFFESQLFHRQIYLIPGAKTKSGADSFAEIEAVNNTRGEEIETIGICGELPEEWRKGRCAVLFPGSHTHAMLVEGDMIVDILSNFSGELFHALTSATILASETAVDGRLAGMPDEAAEGQSASPDGETFGGSSGFDPLRYGCETLKDLGMARGIYVIHATKMFGVGSNSQRRDCLSGMIAGAVAQSLALHRQWRWNGLNRVAVYGKGETVKAYRTALEVFLPAAELLEFCVEDYPQSFAVQGLLRMLDREGQRQ